jgi:hypothetical protein
MDISGTPQKDIRACSDLAAVCGRLDLDLSPWR